MEVRVLSSAPPPGTPGRTAAPEAAGNGAAARRRDGAAEPLKGDGTGRGTAGTGDGHTGPAGAGDGRLRGEGDDAARAGLKPIPAKLPANELDPGAGRAKPRLAARALQMVCRLLAYNAELDLARHLNAYLDDPDEYRAIARNLLHLGGRITFERRRITVTLDRPGSPRVARALGQLLDEIATGTSAHLAGDRRPIVYLMER